MKIKYIVLLSVFSLFLTSCAVLEDMKDSTIFDFIQSGEQESKTPEITVQEVKKAEAPKPEFNAVINKTTYPAIQTPKGANMLDLETPLRCFVNWDTQEMISSIPYNLTAFNLVRNGINSHLPRFEVNGFSFETMPAEKALLKLTKEADIKLVAKDAPYASISAENLRGDFTEVVNMITEAAEVYYTYNSANKTMRISRKANFSLFVPNSRTIMLAVLDVLRGSGISDFTADFDEYSITFDADFELKSKIENLINYFEENPMLLAYDVRVLNLYPYNQNSVEWQQIIQAFEFGSVKSTKTGVLGRILTTSNNINIDSLTQFLSSQAKVENVGEGKFVMPNTWFSRFDIGKCMSEKSILKNLSILAKGVYEPNGKIHSNITVETSGGEVSNFSIRSRIGENFLIIGLPNTIFSANSPLSETVIMIVPRLIRTMKTDSQLENNL